jgi:hypothetical protein
LNKKKRKEKNLPGTDGRHPHPTRLENKKTIDVVSSPRTEPYRISTAENSAASQCIPSLYAIEELDRLGEEAQAVCFLVYLSLPVLKRNDKMYDQHPDVY